MSWNPNSNKHKATHGGYRKKTTLAQSKATFDFFNTSDVFKDFEPNKVNVVLAQPGFGKPISQLKLDL